MLINWWQKKKIGLALIHFILLYFHLETNSKVQKNQKIWSENAVPFLQTLYFLGNLDTISSKWTIKSLMSNDICIQSKSFIGAGYLDTAWYPSSLGKVISLPWVTSLFQVSTVFTIG